LPAAVACSEQALLATTFYYLARRFGRTPEAHPLSLFMSGALSPGLRYCPDCLSERGYYLLPWRFLALEGCHEHGTRLLDQCQQCGQKIPLFTQPLRLGMCPVCGSDLRRGQAEPLTAAARPKVAAWFQDFVELISPFSEEAAQLPVVKLMGQQFTRWRQVRRMRVADAAEYIDQSPATIYFIERGNAQRTSKFQWYLGYLDFLKVSFTTLLNQPLPPQPERTLEEKLLEKAQHVIAYFEQKGALINREEVAKLMVISPSAIKRYPQVKALCTASQAKWYRQWEADVIEQARQTAAKVLAETGQPVSQRDIYRRLDWSLSKFNTHPQIKAAIKRIVEQTQAQYADLVLEKVQAALAELESTDQDVTKTAISALTGLSLRAMGRLPKVNQFLQEQVIDRKPEHDIRRFQRREQQLIQDMEQAIDRLKAAGQPVTRAAVLRVLNQNHSNLELYPRAQLLLKELTLAKDP
jgi:transcriptional regulator with XRE-family HTH domain